MDTNSLDSSDNLNIGDIFTPLEWAEFAINRFKLRQEAEAGKSFFDPTCGDGSFLRVLSPLSNVARNFFGIELNRKHFESLISYVKSCGSDFRVENFQCADFILSDYKRKFDFLVGNPPWLNFADLPESLKEAYKKIFVKYGIVSDAKSLLLGSSRVDLSTLVVAKSMFENLKPNGVAVFYLPLSIFTNDGANKNFRSYKILNRDFSVEEIIDFSEKKVFANIATKYCLAKFQMDKVQEFPIPYYRFKSGQFEKFNAAPIFQKNDPLSIQSTPQSNFTETDLKLNINAIPRQGINTCGANNIMILEPIAHSGGIRYRNGLGHETELESKFIRALIVNDNFKEDLNDPLKFVLIPHDEGSGKPVSEEYLKQFPKTYQYLQRYRETLKNRKGTLIQAQIKKGAWFSLLGVGPYTFLKHKVVWRAYGQKTFNPKLFTDTPEIKWVPNQALQCYVAFENGTEASQTLTKLKNPLIEKYLLSQNAGGSPNWAQPGRMKKLFWAPSERAQEDLRLF
jgi:hypothetical protein